MRGHVYSECPRVKPYLINTHYVGKGYKALFRCPICLRETWQHLNFLGRRAVFCDGQKFVKQFSRFAAVRP